MRNLRFFSGLWLSLALAAASAPSALARERKRVAPDTLEAGPLVYTDAFLDTVNVRKHLTINDYSLFGVQYGISRNTMSFNPVKKQAAFYTPGVVGVTYTRYGKLFGYMPYFGFQIGAFYGQDGYSFKEDEDGFTPSVDGAVKGVYDYVEVPFLAQFHYDVWPVKLMAGLGFYGGWRLRVHREGWMDEAYADAFYDYDRRLDYGIKGGAGVAFIFDPFEIHFTGMLRYGLGSIYDEDYHSAYYYRFASPMDVVLSVGIHFQLTRRTGKTRAALRREAHELVFPKETPAP